MKISIIMPVYNAKNYLGRAVQSIKKQTFTDWELLLVDDGSTDGSAALCDAFANEDARVCVLHQENGGTSAARNAGIAAAKGEYIAFMDNDDWALPAWLQDMVCAADENDADLVKCGYAQVWENGTDCTCILTQNDLPVKSVRAPLEQEILNGKEFLQRLATGWTHNAVWNQLCRTTIMQQCPFPEGHLSEDVSVCIDLSLRVNKVVCLPQILYCWMQRSSSQTYTSCRMNIDHAGTHSRMIEMLLADGDTKTARICAAKKARMILTGPMGANAVAEKKYRVIADGLFKGMQQDEKMLHFLPLMNRVEKMQYIIYACCPPLYNVIMCIKAAL